MPDDTETVESLNEDALKDVWNEFRKIFLDGIERLENKSCSKGEVFADGK